VIGLPGEFVELNDGEIKVNGVVLDEPYIKEPCHCGTKQWSLGVDQYLVMGDNRNNSYDSTEFGPVERSAIMGEAFIEYWPPENWRVFIHPDYQR
jgi:signal peptidase I